MPHLNLLAAVQQAIQGNHAVPKLRAAGKQRECCCGGHPRLQQAPLAAAATPVAAAAITAVTGCGITEAAAQPMRRRSQAGKQRQLAALGRLRALRLRGCRLRRVPAPPLLWQQLVAVAPARVAAERVQQHHRQPGAQVAGPQRQLQREAGVALAWQAQRPGGNWDERLRGSRQQGSECNECMDCLQRMQQLTACPPHLAPTSSHLWLPQHKGPQCNT